MKKRRTKKRAPAKRTIPVRSRKWLAIVVCVLLASTWFWNRRFEQSFLRTVPPFKMQTLDGAHLHLSDFSHRRAVVAVFLGTECPISNAYLPLLTEMANEYANHGVEFIGINSSNDESIGEMNDHAKEYAIAYRLVKDWDGRIARTLGATRTAEVFVLDPQGHLYYQGRIDDRNEFQARKEKPTREYLRDALNRFAYRVPASPARTEAQGCLLNLPEAAPAATPEKKLTYSHDIRPIVDRHCVSCHNPKGMAPFPLTTYDHIKEWAPMIESVLADRLMPPWHADPRYGEWQDDRAMPEAQLKRFMTWLSEGLAPGNPNGLVSRTPTALDGWQLGKPDFVVETDKYRIKATGLSYFENYYYKSDFKEDTWISAVEILPGNPKVVHHVTVYVIPPGSDTPLDWDDWGFFAAHSPGYSKATFPQGYAKKIPARSTIYVEMHYAPRGKPDTDQTKVGFHLARGGNYKEAHTLGLGSREFTIPAGDPNYRIEEHHRFPAPITLFGIYPHGHYRAKSFRLLAEVPGAKPETIISVPNYDLAWQNYYQLKTPKRYPAGTVFTCDSLYDNSHRNPRNPNPSVAVSWGPKTEDEMNYCFVDYAFEGRARAISGTR